jgi:predicted GIY-YIG superfamily endonuclease
MVFKMKYECPFKETFYIYKIINIITQKIYIGRTKNPAYRYGQHKHLSLNIEKTIGDIVMYKTWK